MSQTTIARTVLCKGIGLHSGLPSEVRIHPAPCGSGLVFLCRSAGDAGQIRLNPYCVESTLLATQINQGNCTVKTVEHLLAALAGIGVDNAIVEINSNEVPILDGSAMPFVEAILDAGLILQSGERLGLRITKPVSCSDGDKLVYAEPYAGFKLDYTIDFDHPAIMSQQLALDITPETFLQLASARTFGFARDVQAMLQNGLALGGALSNAVVLNAEGVLNPEGLRYPDEFVRHKMLDFIGDMAVLGQPLLGAFTVRFSGHKLNNMFLRQLLEQPDCLEQVQLPETRHSLIAPAKRKERQLTSA